MKIGTSLYFPYSENLSSVYSKPIQLIFEHFFYKITVAYLLKALGNPSICPKFRSPIRCVRFIFFVNLFVTLLMDKGAKFLMVKSCILSSKIEFYAKFFFQTHPFRICRQIECGDGIFFTIRTWEISSKTEKKNVYSFQIAITTYVPSIITKVLHSLLKCY